MTTRVLPTAAVLMCLASLFPACLDAPADESSATPDAGGSDGILIGTTTAGSGSTSAATFTATATGGSGATSDSGGGELGTGGDDDSNCRDDAEFFATQVYGDVLDRHCVECHRPNGAAQHTDFRLVDASAGPDWMVRNRRTTTTTAQRRIGGESILLVKPTNTVVHGGGKKISDDGLDFAILSEFIWRYENPDGQCPEDDTGDSQSTSDSGDETTGMDATGSDSSGDSQDESASDTADDSSDTGNQDDCVSDREHFEDYAYARVLSPRCELCHNPSGGAKDSDLVLVGPWWGPNFFEKNRSVVDAVAAKRHSNGESLLLAKPTNVVDHAGGEQLKPGEEAHDILLEYLERLDDPDSNGCDASDDDLTRAFEKVDLIDAATTLRKAAILMLGRLPTSAEVTRAETGPRELRAVLRGLMQGEAFYEWVKLEWNDLLLTDRTREIGAAAFPDEIDFPNRFWFFQIEDPAERLAAAQGVNEGITRSALELLEFVLREDRPITEILTADYMMMNPYGAISLSMDLEFEDPNDPGEFAAGRLPGQPLAGMLSTLPFLNRYPTTATNLNRLRSRTVYSIFLGTDILALSRPIDTSSTDDENPTLTNPNCTICHEILDPIAGAFANWNDTGAYRPNDWHDDMLPPGFNKAVMPESEKSAGLQWLARQLIGDRRFALAMAHIALRSLTGRPPLTMPGDATDPRFGPMLRAYKIQSLALNTMADRLAETDFDYRELLLEVLMSPYFRAADSSPLSPEERRVFADLGLSRLLSPEHLDRKIEAITGYPWAESGQSPRFLLDPDYFPIFYGGIDSDEIIERAAVPNGPSANVVERMSRQVACNVSARDFALEPENRLLFPFVELDQIPVDAAGNEDAPAVAAVRKNLVHLFSRVLDEAHRSDNAEIDVAYELFTAAMLDGQRGVAAGEYGPSPYRQCTNATDFWTGEPTPSDQIFDEDRDFTLRAWTTVLAYLLSDIHFIYE